MHKSHTWEKSGSWDMGKNAFNESDCSIFKLTIPLEQNDKKAWSFSYWFQFIEMISWLKSIGMGVVKNGCSYSGLRTLKLALYQEGINRVSWLWCVDKNSGNLNVILIIFALCLGFDLSSWSVVVIIYLFAAPYHIGCIKMKTYSPTSFSSPWSNIFLTITENKFTAWNYHFSCPTHIHLF